MLKEKHYLNIVHLIMIILLQNYNIFKKLGITCNSGMSNLRLLIQNFEANHTTEFSDMKSTFNYFCIIVLLHYYEKKHVVYLMF